MEGMWRSIPCLRLPPWIEENVGLQSMGLQRLRHDWVTEHTYRICICKYMYLSMYVYVFNSVHCKDQEAKILVQRSYLIPKSWSLVLFFAKLNRGSSKKWLILGMEQSRYLMNLKHLVMPEIRKWYDKNHRGKNVTRVWQPFWRDSSWPNLE